MRSHSLVLSVENLNRLDLDIYYALNNASFMTDYLGLLIKFLEAPNSEQLNSKDIKGIVETIHKKSSQLCTTLYDISDLTKDLPSNA